MRSLIAFAAGGLLGALLVALFPRAPTPDPDAAARRWRERVAAAEEESAAARRQVAELTDKLTDLSAQYRDLERRFEALAARHAEPAPQPDGVAVSTTPAPVPPTVGFQPVPAEQWEALVSDALESEIESRLGTALAPEAVERLVDTLARVRDAARGLDADEEADDATRRRLEATRHVLLLQADRAFREETGIGVADFLRGLDPGQVEEVPQ